MYLCDFKFFVFIRIDDTPAFLISNEVLSEDILLKSTGKFSVKVILESVRVNICSIAEAYPSKVVHSLNCLLSKSVPSVFLSVTKYGLILHISKDSFNTPSIVGCTVHTGVSTVIVCLIGFTASATAFPLCAFSLSGLYPWSTFGILSSSISSLVK